MPLFARLHAFATVLALSLGLAAPALGAEATKFEVDFYEQGSERPTNHATIWISGRRIRIEQQQPGARKGGPVLIYRGEEGRFLSVHPRARSYSEIARERVSELGHEARRARREIDQQLEALPSDQQKALERLLGIRREGRDLVEAPVVVTPEEGGSRIAGLECRNVTMKRGDSLVGRACVVPWRRLGLAHTDLEVFRELGLFQREVLQARALTPMELVPDQPLDLLVQFEGLPLSFHRTTNGSPRSAIRVAGIERLVADDALFEAPADYAMRGGGSAFLGHLGLGGSPASPALR